MLRGELLDLDPRCVAMIDAARAAGAAANYTGSGGAIVAVRPDDGALEDVRDALEAIGCEAHITACRSSRRSCTAG